MNPQKGAYCKTSHCRNSCTRCKPTVDTHAYLIKKQYLKSAFFVKQNKKITIFARLNTVNAAVPKL